MSHFGYKVEKGKPIIKKVPVEPPMPVTTPHSRAFMRQENENGSGMYFNDRKIAFEDATQQWLILYESKELKLMNEGSKYLDVFEKTVEDEITGDDDETSKKNISRAIQRELDEASVKKATHVIEFSAAIYKDGRMILESVCRTTGISARRGRFYIVPAIHRKRFFKTETVTKKQYPLMRQCSDDITKTSDFRVLCRPIQSKSIDIVFVVHHKSIRLTLPPIIDKKTYWDLIKTPNVLLFKQNKTTTSKV
jgi:hypothetical protein